MILDSLSLSWLLFSIASVRAASIVSISADSTSVEYSPGWVASGPANSTGVLAFTDILGAGFKVVLPNETVSFDYLGVKRELGASYGVCVDCTDAAVGAFEIIDGHNATLPSDDQTPTVIFSVSNLDPTTMHTLTLTNLPDDRFSDTGQVLFHSLRAVIEDDGEGPAPTNTGDPDPAPPPTGSGGPLDPLPSSTTMSNTPTSTDSGATSTIQQQPTDTSSNSGAVSSTTNSQSSPTDSSQTTAPSSSTDSGGAGASSTGASTGASSTATGATSFSTGTGSTSSTTGSITGSATVPTNSGSSSTGPASSTNTQLGSTTSDPSSSSNSQAIAPAAIAVIVILSIFALVTFVIGIIFLRRVQARRAARANYAANPYPPNDDPFTRRITAFGTRAVPPPPGVPEVTQSSDPTTTSGYHPYSDSMAESGEMYRVTDSSQEHAAITAWPNGTHSSNSLYYNGNNHSPYEDQTAGQQGGMSWIGRTPNRA